MKGEGRDGRKEGSDLERPVGGGLRSGWSSVMEICKGLIALAIIIRNHTVQAVCGVNRVSLPVNDPPPPSQKSVQLAKNIYSARIVWL